ncbi:MAG: methylmalonyl-CoA epimerase [Chloroflexota bacterium]|nr:methylmalonyl-CoA epimerase [Chloroflexota bacterium]
MIKRLHHVCIVVKNIDETAKVYQDLFGVKAGHSQVMPEQGVKAVLIPIGDTEIELIEPIDSKSGVAKFLESKGEGLHHICLEVDDVDKELKRLDAKGTALVDKVGRGGLAGKVGFLHPKATKGVLIELAQPVK